MPNWKKVIVSGSNASLNSITASNGAVITGSLLVSGSLNVSSGITADLTGTASYASNSNLLDGIDSTAFAQLASANTFTNNQIISGSLTVFTGSAIEFQVTNTGTKIGNLITDVHTITGSVGVSGSITATGFTGGAGSFSTLTSTSTTTLASATGTQTIALGAGATTTAATKTINIGTAGVSGSTTNVNIGSAVVGAVGTITLNENAIVTGSLTVFSGSAVDFQVTDTGTKIGNLITDIHTITGSLNISGSVFITSSLGVGVAPSATVGRIDASNDVVAFSTSDIRFKENITPIPNALDKLNKIGGYTFDWNSDPELTKLHGFKGHDIGVIAQEIEKVLPELVTTRDNGYKAVKYEKLVALLIESNKELLKRIEVLESKINQ
jgi:hypothetical protein